MNKVIPRNKCPHYNKDYLYCIKGEQKSQEECEIEQGSPLCRKPDDEAEKNRCELLGIITTPCNPNDTTVVLQISGFHNWIDEIADGVDCPDKSSY